MLCQSELPEVLRAQVELPKKQGLLVHEVVPEGPGAKVGIQPMDILVKVNGKSIGSIADLVTAVDEAKDKEVSIDVLRKGKSQTVKVVPAKRPAEYQGKQYPAVTGPARTRSASTNGSSGCIPVGVGNRRCGFGFFIPA